MSWKMLKLMVDVYDVHPVLLVHLVDVDVMLLLPRRLC